MSGDPYFGPELFAFLRELRQNNDRGWFQANRERYEAHVREPMLRFIAEFGPRLEAISPSLVADPRPVGGSLFRIYRDIRFSRDKSPYKTHAAAQFRHEWGRDAHTPGFYLHLEPGDIFFGCGLWHPEPEPLRRVRDAIVAHPARWQRAISGKAFTAKWMLGGESVKRAPAGYDPEHPLIEHLKRKDYTARSGFTEEEACEARFLDHVAEVSQAAGPFLRFLASALGLPW